MKKVERVMLNMLEKVSREIIEREKNGQSFCPVIWHQPKRPNEVKGKKWK